jgi:hypothetical protein
VIPPLIQWLAGALLRLITSVSQPRVAQCPSGWYVNGVRPAGDSSCIDARDPRPEDTRGECHHEHIEVDALPIRVWCDEDELAVVRDERTIACRKGTS